jgi:hypothetical protein
MSEDWPRQFQYFAITCGKCDTKILIEGSYPEHNDTPVIRPYYTDDSQSAFLCMKCGNRIELGFGK